MITATIDTEVTGNAAGPASRRNAIAAAGLVTAVAAGTEASRLAAIGQLVALGYTAHELAEIERAANEFVAAIP